MRLRFAELAGAIPGQRVFDVKVQGLPRLKGLDVAHEAGGPNRSLVKEIPGVTADRMLDVEFIPTSSAADRRLPIVAGMELVQE